MDKQSRKNYLKIYHEKYREKRKELNKEYFKEYYLRIKVVNEPKKELIINKDILVSYEETTTLFQALDSTNLTVSFD